MLDSTRFEPNIGTARSKEYSVRCIRGTGLRGLLIQQSRRNRVSWARRTPLRVDRSRYGGEGRLDHSTSLRNAVV